MCAGGEGGGFVREDSVAELPRGSHVRGAEVFPQPPFGEVRQVDGAVKPPSAVVVPEVVIGTAGFLAAGDFLRFHSDVVVWIHNIAMPGKAERPS